jgi:hypothetical protein
MRKEYKESIILAIVIGILSTILLFIIQRKVAWAYLFSFPIFYAIFRIYIITRRGRPAE